MIGDFLYPREVMFQRPVDISSDATTQGSGYGGIGDGGAIDQSFEILTLWMPASIAISGHGGKPEIALPQDPDVRPFYVVEIPHGYLREGDVQFRDRMTDDLSIRYTVTNIQATPMGWGISVQQVSV